MNKEEREYKAEIRNKTTEKLMSDMAYFGYDSYYGELGNIVRDEIERRLNLFDKLVSKEISVDDIPKLEEEQRRETAINALIGFADEEYNLVYNMIESKDYAIIQNNSGSYDVYDKVNNEIVELGFDSVSSVIDYVVGDNILDELEHEAHQQGISNIPQTGDEWREAVIRPDLQDFINGHQTEIGQVLLIADPDRMNKNISLKELADDFDVEMPRICESPCEEIDV